MAFAENLTVFFDTDEFAVSATYTPAGGAAATVNGIFDNGYDEPALGLAGIAARGPAFTCRAADVAANPEGDALVVNGTAYTIAVAEPDGTGVTVLRLKV